VAPATSVMVIGPLAGFSDGALVMFLLELERLRLRSGQTRNLCRVSCSRRQSLLPSINAPPAARYQRLPV